MAIEDKELRYLFKTESEEHIQKLESGFLELEKNPENAEVLTELFREAHSLKGSARLVGANDVEEVGHLLEDILSSAKRGEEKLTVEVMNNLYSGLDGIRKLVHEAVTGEQKTTLDVVLAQLQGEEIKPILQKQKSSTVEKATKQSFTQEPVNFSPEENSSQSSMKFETSKIQKVSRRRASREEDSGEQIEKYHIDTIRVEPHRLDTLLTQAGELSVTKRRIDQRILDLEEAVSLIEDCSRQLTSTGVVHRELAYSFTQDKLEQLKEQILGIQDHFQTLDGSLKTLQTNLAEDSARLNLVSSEMEEGIRNIRLLPLSTIFNLFHRMVRDLGQKQSKDIQLNVEGGDTTADKLVLEEMKAPIMHIIRNAIDHGIEEPDIRERKGKPATATVSLRAYQTSTDIVIEISDDGKGLDLDAIKAQAIKQKLCRNDDLDAMTETQIQSLIFSPGFSTSPIVSDISGRGVGLDVVYANVLRLKGSIFVESKPDIGCTFRILLPITLATARVMIVSVEERSYALPVENIQTSCKVTKDEIFTIESNATINLDDQAISVAYLADLLELKNNSLKYSQSKKNWCIIVKVGDDSIGLFVDALLDEQEVVVKPNAPILKRVRNVSGATILGTGEICVVLNPHDLVKSITMHGGAVTPEAITTTEVRKKRILLAEDSITTRTQEKRILESAGYDVVVCVDGLHAFNQLDKHIFDAVVSDIEMPNMDGLTLTKKIRENEEYKEIPIILVTSLATEKDKKRGIEVGANAYITKASFNHEVLLETLGRLI